MVDYEGWASRGRLDSWELTRFLQEGLGGLEGLESDVGAEGVTAEEDF